MPIYEFYCADCNTVFNFYARTVNTTKTPKCPKCKKAKLKRQVSLFAETGKHGENSEGSPLDGIDESKMERAVDALASEAGKINENDPKQAAQLMRKFSSMTGIKFKGAMENALNRLEAGENPEQVDADMGQLMDGEEDPFELPGKGTKGSGSSGKTRAPQRDTTLYDL